MTSSKFFVSTQVNRDRTKVNHPYSIHVKISLMDDEFKSRINNYIKATEPVLVFEDIYIPLISNLFKRSRYQLSILPEHKVAYQNPVYYQNKLFITKLHLEEDLSASDVEEMIFSIEEVAVDAQNLVEKQINNFLLQQEEIFMSI